jgi:hypothetical protein
MTTLISSCRDFGKLMDCRIIDGQVKKFSVKNIETSKPHEMVQDVTLRLPDARVKAV